MQIHHIRNFSIIAHIDHGKSTIADRIIELCRGLESREMKQQVLDSMEVEQRRGITVKAQTVRLQYEAKDGKNYMLNLIDTPGHADFSYEVSRSLAACEGVILVVDASQGVEAQTLANTYKAIENDLEIVIALNKIDLPTANIEQVKSQIKDVIGLESEDAILVSGKTGNGIEALIESIIAKIPPPSSNTKTDQFNLKAMILDSWYDKYLGIVTLIRVVDGFIQTHQKIKTLSNNEEYIVERVGAFTPKRIELDNLYAGEVGFITSSIKNAQDCKVGDTIVDHLNNSASPLPGFKEVKSMVFCSVYPEEVSEFEKLKVSFERLKLNDSSLHYEIENSGALGFGLRCGFLGLLHLEVVQERLENEFDLNIITTAPSVLYKLHLTSGDSIYLYNPMQMPHPTKILYMEEPWIKATIILPDTYLGSILNLCTEKRGIQEEMLQTGNKVMLSYKLPLNEVVYDFYDKVKSLSKGYASFDWEFDSYVKSDLVKVDILVNGVNVDSLSAILHRSSSEKRSRQICIKLKELIPRHLFAVPIQASIGGKVIARETVSALRKDVTAKCYGGDFTRKRKLLEKQKEGKKRMRSIGQVNVPKSAFIEVLKT